MNETTYKEGYKGLDPDQYAAIYASYKKGLYNSMDEAVELVEWLVNDVEYTTEEAVEIVIKG